MTLALALALTSLWFESLLPPHSRAQMTQDSQRVMECTTSKFDGLISLIRPEESWVAKWQRVGACVVVAAAAATARTHARTHSSLPSAALADGSSDCPRFPSNPAQKNAHRVSMQSRPADGSPTTSKKRCTGDRTQRVASPPPDVCSPLSDCILHYRSQHNPEKENVKVLGGARVLVYRSSCVRVWSAIQGHARLAT